VQHAPHKPRVLLLGDLAVIGRVAKDAIEHSGRDTVELMCIGTLSEGIVRLRNNPPDVVLFDLDLPDSHGLRTLEEIIGASPGIPVLVLSSDTSREMLRLVLASGGQDCLIKDQLKSDTLARALNGAIARKDAEDALFFEKERAQITLNSIADGVLTVDSAGVITYLNIRAQQMTGWTQREAMGRPLREVFRVIDPVTREDALEPIHIALRDNRIVALSPNSVLVHRDGTESTVEDSIAPMHDRTGALEGAVVVFHDVSDARAMALKMAYLAQHDPLTNLPNRGLLTNRVNDSIQMARRHGRSGALLFMDLDHFKHINDSLGHHTGDELLKLVAQRLIESVRKADMLTRLGGDEFVVLLGEVRHAEDAVRVVEHIRHSLRAPCLIDGHQLQISASIGISIFPLDGDDAETVIKNADTAMYHAKSCGRDNFQFFNPQMNAIAVERQTIEEELRHALTLGELTVHYQPKVNLGSGAITGVEALIRWRHPSRGLLLPSTFLSIAEDSRLIVPIGLWVLRESCRQMQAWLEAGFALSRIAVNVSSVELARNDYLEQVTSILADTGLDARRLELELTESALMRDEGAIAKLLRALSALGVNLAVDDFGTGYSSLSRLKVFPIDTLKIDRSFVHDVPGDEDDNAMVSTIIAMAQTLRLGVIAEGIETEEQLAFLRTHNCAEGQGYHFGRPVSATEFRTHFEQHVFATI
jgi:diguanylate cyclase (GGDEF)-like protein/PAS domain S-box-containing protein